MRKLESLKIQSGDLLAWSRSTGGFVERAIVALVRMATMSEYAHVGIAYVENGAVYVVEATTPVVRKIRLTEKEVFYHVPMGLELVSPVMSFRFFDDKIGLDYSYMDAVRAFLGTRLEKDNRWQCAELANYFYQSVGVDLGNAWTPSEVVRAAMETRNTYVQVHLPEFN